MSAGGGGHLPKLTMKAGEEQTKATSGQAPEYVDEKMEIQRRAPAGWSPEFLIGKKRKTLGLCEEGEGG